VDELARIDYELAYADRRLGRLEDGLQAIQRTIDIIESQRLKMSAFDSRASYFASVHKYYSLYIQLLMRGHARNPQDQLSATALEASERSKVRSLLDWLAGSQQDAPCDELLKSQLEMTEAATTPADAGGSHGSPLPEAARALTLDQIQSEIAGHDAILLEYALGDEKSYLWIVDGRQISWHELPPADQLDRLVHRFRNAITAQQPRPGENNTQYLDRIREAERAYPQYAAELSGLLLGPVPLGSAKRVIIVPDGPLQYVPFAALSVPGQKSGQAILAARHEVIILPSASALGALRKSVARRPPPTKLAAVFADPRYERNETGGPKTRERQDRALATGGSFVPRGWIDVHGSKPIPRLLGSHEEAVAVAKLGNANEVFVAERSKASRDTVLHLDLGSYRNIHFGTHGVADWKHPERSGLILSLFDSKGKPQNGFLGLNDIYGLKLSADLVVLSSCDSALGEELSSEGIIGLPRAFLRAGAKSVMATLWKVDDEATAELMKHFYALLGQGELPASALRNSQLQLTREKRFSDPYYWAAFVLQGDYL
jgi:CHAT domain-containing protein